MPALHSDTVVRAHAMGIGLTDLERIALGATLIQTVLSPDHAAHVAQAGRVINEHAEALAAAALELPGWSPSGQATTHEQWDLSGSSDLAGSEPPTLRAAFSSRWRAAWGWILDRLDRLENSLLGDVIGWACLMVILGVILVFLPLVIG